MALDLRRLDERNRLDRSLVGDAREAGGPDRANFQEFNAALHNARRPVLKDRASARQARGIGSKNPIVGGTNPGEVEGLLEHIIEQLLPGLDLAPELAAIAAGILSEEMEIARNLNSRIAEANAIDIRSQ